MLGNAGHQNSDIDILLAPVCVFGGADESEELDETIQNVQKVYIYFKRRYVKLKTPCACRKNYNNSKSLSRGTLLLPS